MTSNPQNVVMKKTGDLVQHKLSSVLTNIFNDDELFFLSTALEEVPQIRAENPNEDMRMVLNKWADRQLRQVGWPVGEAHASPPPFCN